MNEGAPKTISVPEAGARYYELSRNGSYDAAKRGEIPTIKVGRLLRVPVAAMERKLEQETPRTIDLDRERGFTWPTPMRGDSPCDFEEHSGNRSGPHRSR
jgi:hypothetical protein